jgi:type II secretory pathway pseudopilin PulG
MKNDNSSSHQKTDAGFTLPAILVVVSALLILAVGILLVVGVERNTSRSFVDREKAELAARAALEEVKGIFQNEAANDDYLIVQSHLETPITPDFQSPAHLFLARGKVDSGTLGYRYIPLFSTSSTPSETPNLLSPAVEPLIGGNKNQYQDFTTLPYNDKVRMTWIPIRDQKNRVIARYAYWIEDLQSRIDPTLTGNQKGPSNSHLFNQYPFPAPGVNPHPATPNEPPLGQVGLYAVDGTATDEKPGELETTLIRNRKLLISPSSLLVAAGFAPPMTRLNAATSQGKIGQLADMKSRAVEENLTAGIQPYMEQPVIPFLEGIASTEFGKPKINLNKILATGSDAAVDEIAAIVNKALPKFRDRNPAFPATSEDYIKTLAANVIDYADSDSDSTAKLGSHRGIDAFPLMSEFLMSFKWVGIRIEGGRKFVLIQVTTYAELWNMTDKEIKQTDGEIQVSYETKYRFTIPPLPELSLGELSNAVAVPPLTESDGYRWFNPFRVNLKSNEYKVIKCGSVNYKIDACPAGKTIASPITMVGEQDGLSKAGFRIKWNGKMIDRSPGGVNRISASLYFPKTTNVFHSQQKVREFVPSHSYQRDGVFKENMGDARMSFYLQACAYPYDFPYNYSPNRRNLRFGNVYSRSTTPVYGRVMPSEWPDGGHNSEYGSNNFFSTYDPNDEEISPDDARFFQPNELPIPKIGEAPVLLSNRGRYYSATELGRISDPLLWDVGLPTVPNQPWGDITNTTQPSADHGGGNTLRIGRPEHPRFSPPNDPGLQATRWLDLFHAGISSSQNLALREGPVTEIQGKININTASRGALRALVAGPLGMDPRLAVRTSEIHDKTRLMAPPIELITLSPPTMTEQADRIADAIIRSRPYAATSNLALAKEDSNTYVFGNRNLFPNATKIEWTDAAAEELFARVYEASTVRSRNFRIWVVAQSVVPSTSTTRELEILAEVKKAYTVFIDPGIRNTGGEINPQNVKLQILHENNF